MPIHLKEQDLAIALLVLSRDGTLMPTRKDRPAPDLRNLDQAGK
jgi:hypothetical protein